MDIAEFIEARLDEDALAARNAGGEVWDFTGVNCEVRVRPSGRKGYGDFGRIIAYTRHGNPVEEDLALAIHVGWHDPARALRQVAAIRRVLARHHADDYGRCAGCPRDSSGEPDYKADECMEKRDIAAIWDGHEDYLASWKPDA